MPHHIEQKAEQIARELNRGQINQAANDLRFEVQQHPHEAMAIIQRANQLRDQRSPDHIVVDRNGNVSVRDEYRHTQAYAGTIQFNNDCYGNNYNNNRNYDNRGYYPNQPGYPQQPCEQPNYRQQPCDQRQIYIPDCYGNNNERRGISPGAALGIGILGGIILDRALGHGRDYHRR